VPACGCDGVEALWPILTTRKEEREKMNELRRHGGEGEEWYKSRRRVKWMVVWA